MNLWSIWIKCGDPKACGFPQDHPVHRLAEFHDKTPAITYYSDLKKQFPNHEREYYVVSPGGGIFTPPVEVECPCPQARCKRVQEVFLIAPGDAWGAGTVITWRQLTMDKIAVLLLEPQGNADTYAVVVFDTRNYCTLRNTGFNAFISAYNAYQNQRA